MQNGGSIKVLWWNELKEFVVTLCIQMFMNNVPVAETQMPITSEEFRLSTVDKLQLG